MTDPETPDEAYEQLLRETRPGEQIDKLQAAVDHGLPAIVLHPAQARVIIGQLRELRARRIAAGREPDDEVNAPADMCCCHDWPRTTTYEPDPQFAEGCPLHPRAELTGAEFLEQAKAALDGGLELREDMGFCVGCGSRECTCDPADEGFEF